MDITRLEQGYCIEMAKLVAMISLRSVALTVVLLAAAAAGTSVAAGTSPPQQVLPPRGVTYPAGLTLPAIPSSTTSAASFIGHATSARPLKWTATPHNPFMAANGRSNLHDDAYQTNAYRGAGPSGASTTVTSAYLQEECASVTFDRRGQLVSVCVGAVGETLEVFAPKTLELLASYPLPVGSKIGVGTVTGGGTTTSSSFGGGGYFYLDNHDDAVVPTVDGRIAVLHVSDSAHPAVTLRKTYDISGAIDGQTIESALPDWAGRLWFVTTGGIVGIAKPSGTGARDVQLVSPKHAKVNAGQPEKIGNSFAIDESGGVYVVSEEALYRFAAHAGRPHVVWRKTYNHGNRLKPGQVNFGSGTTPTLIGKSDRPGGGLVAILDNADPSMHVDVFRRGRHVAHRDVCSVRIFRDHPKANSDENNLISLGNRLWAENNYGQPGPVQVTTTTPGMQEIKLGGRRGCSAGWESNAVRVPSVVSKVSAASGVIYTYTHPAQSTSSPPAWYLTAVRARTGKRLWSRLVGVGALYNNYYSPITLGPDGAIYIGTFGGLVEVRGPHTR
jgi:hypothetical protein